MLNMLERVKLALVISANDFDSEINSYINAACKDLGLAGVEGLTVTTSSDDDLVITAIISYVGFRYEMMKGSLEKSNAFKRAYDEQKASMGMATGYTVWSDAE